MCANLERPHEKVIVVALAMLSVSGLAQAQEPWPTRPVTSGKLRGAGGPVDIVGRIMSARLSEILGQQVIIENSVGAGGMTGSSRVAKAPPDGYTFLLGGLSVLAQNQTLYRRPMYDARTDFAPVSPFADSARILITARISPVKTLLEFVAYAKANAGRMQLGLRRAPAPACISAACCSMPPWGLRSCTCPTAPVPTPCRT